jgi:hypothetical protein
MKRLLIVFQFFIFNADLFSQTICKEPMPGEIPSINQSKSGYTPKETWKTGQTIRILFLDGSDDEHQSVREAAAEWLAQANIIFEFVDAGSSDVRISFLNDGNWSFRGTQALKINQRKATMNIEMPGKSVILHEFGHMLGLIHEHQQPGATVCIDKQAAYKYYWDHDRWSPKMVDEQIIKQYNQRQTNFCEYDSTSIMHYSLPDTVTCRKLEYAETNELSDEDKRVMRLIYPFSGDDNRYWTKAGNTGKWYIGDFNGDGRHDIFRMMPQKQGTEVFLSDGTKFIKSGYWTNASKGNQDWYVGDFNGDGMDDIFRYVAGKGGADVFLSTGTSFQHSGIWATAGNSGKWYIGDFNGDGKDDIFRLMPEKEGTEVFLSDGTKFIKSGYWTTASKGSHDWTIGDFNGDGSDDISRYVAGAGGAQVFLSNGTSFKNADIWTTAGNTGKWYVGDYNGDGKDDIFRLMPKIQGTEVFLNDGTRFLKSGYWSGVSKGSQDWYIGDFNGDGRSDIFRYVSYKGGANMFLSDGMRFLSAGPGCNF